MSVLSLRPLRMELRSAASTMEQDPVPKQTELKNKEEKKA